MARFEDQDLTDAEFRECDLTRARLIGVVMQDAVIDGLVRNLVVNGVEVTSCVEAELDRRHPVRRLIRSADPADLREAFRQLRADWAATLGRLRGMPKGSENQRAGGEWSAVETLRHLVFVHDSWFRRCCLGSAEPFTAIGLASEFVPDQEEQGLDRAATPSLDEVLAAVRQGQVGARVRARGAGRGVGAPRLLRARPRSARVPLAKCCAEAGTLSRTLGTREYSRRRHPAVRLAQRAKLPQP
jgi:hypothetical protein